MSRQPAPERRLYSAKIVVAGGISSTAFINAASDGPLATMTAESPSGGRVPFEFGRLTLDPGLTLHLFGTHGQDRHPQVRDELLPGALGGVILVDPGQPHQARPAVGVFQTAGVSFVLGIARFGGGTAAADKITGATPAALRALLGVTEETTVLPCRPGSRSSAKAVLTGLIEQLMRPALDWRLPVEPNPSLAVGA